MPRSVTTDSVFELALVNYDRYHTEQDSWIQLYWKPFFMESRNGSCLARYFLPNNKACVMLDESGLGDIDPLWFNLISSQETFYTSKVCFCPTRKAYGAVLEMYIDFACNWWLGVVATPMKVKHNLHVREFDQLYPGTLPGFADACDGFNNDTWTSGKIPCCERSHVGVDDIQLKLGYDFYKNDENHATFYAVGTIPTGKRVTSQVLFEPLVGTRHGSFGFGFNGDCRVYACNDHDIAFLGDIKYRYAFSAMERRSFDLCANGDWSRYLIVITEQEPLNSLPGINLFTLPVKVTPRSTLDMWLAAHYHYCNWHFELGYDLWWRQAEKLCLGACGIASGYGIQTLNICPMGATTASTATISQAVSGANGVTNDASFVQLQTIDLNVNSAAHPSAHSQTVYGTLGYAANFCDCPMLLGVGASYEFDAHNALSQWAVWFTQGFDF